MKSLGINSVIGKNKMIGKFYEDKTRNNLKVQLMFCELFKKLIVILDLE